LKQVELVPWPRPGRECVCGVTDVRRGGHAGRAEGVRRNASLRGERVVGTSLGFVRTLSASTRQDRKRVMPVSSRQLCVSCQRLA
jgi:hypothetical protein